MPDIVKRLNYYNHQFLSAPDFLDEQNYHLSMRRLHNSALHTWGVVQGLQVALAGGGTGTAVTVNAGVALDSAGREIVLASDTNLELGGAAAGATLVVTIAYDEQQSDPTTEAGGPGNTRVTESPRLSFSTSPPADNSTTLILARVPRTSTGLGPIDSSDRKQAGVVLGSQLTVDTLTLKQDGVAQANWPALSCSAANQAALANAGLTVSGSVGIGPTAANRNLTVSGAGATGVYANVKNANHEVLIGVDSAAILSAMTASDLQIRTSNTTRLTVHAASGNVGVGATADRAKLQVDGSVGNTVALFGNNQGVSMVAAWPCVGFNSYFNGAWKSISPGFTGVIDVDQNDGSMNFFVNPTKAAAADTSFSPVSRLAIQANGKLSSSMWRATQVMNQRQGALPQSATFASGGGTLLIIYSGSGWGSGNIGMTLQVDGASVGVTRSFTNEQQSHKAFTTNFAFLPNIAAGNHTVTLVALPGTNTDGNDWYNVAVIELPI